jgi:hypothetical protein
MKQAAKQSRIRATIALLCTAGYSLSAYSELKPMDDSALDETVGQAYIKMDSYQDIDSNHISRVTFGQTVNIQTNIDSVRLGDGYNGGTDLAATHVSLGHINSAGEIIPFTFENPYFEWATDATNNIVGFRVGAENTKGIMQADWSSFSGHIGMTIDGQPAQLHSGTGTGTSTIDRATHIGSNANDCAVGSNCLALTDILSLSVGDSASANDSNNVPTTGTEDFFLSFQATAMKWNLGAGGTRTTNTGFFMNIPTNNAITTAGGGTPGYTVEFIDRGIGRWHN